MYLCKEPLFVNVEEGPDRSPQQLEGQNITIPISYTLLEQLNSFQENNGSLSKIKQTLNSIIKAPLYLFPECPLVFDRDDSISVFVPDDNFEHDFNWRALILQVHISLLSTLGWLAISSHRGTARSLDDLSDPRINNNNPALSESQRRHANFGSRNYATGSISLREQNRCVASFSNRTLGSLGCPSYESIQLEVAPQIERGKGSTSDANTLDEEVDINTLCELQLICSYTENPLFRSIILAIVSRGLLDQALGIKLIDNLESQLKTAHVMIPTFSDESDVYFNSYEQSFQRNLLTPEEEESLLLDLSQDQVNSVLDKIESLQPFDLIPHTKEFIENCLAPLCYHENPIFASRATALYTTFINGHSWDLKETQVSTYDAKLPIKFVPDHVVLLAATGADEQVYFSIIPPSNNSFSFTPSGSGFYDWVYARSKGSGGFEIDNAFPANRAIVLPAAARKEVIHELPAFDDKGPIKFSKLAENLEDLATAGVTAIHIPGAIERSSLHSMSSLTDRSLLSKECGGLEEFKELVQRAKQYNLRILTDFSPLVSVSNFSRKYTAFSTLQCDNSGRLYTASIPGSDNLLLNVRSVRYWETVTREIKELAQTSGITGFFLGRIWQWDYALPRNKKELMRVDPDGELHYGTQNIIQGSVVQGNSINDLCGISSHDAKSNPFLTKLLRSLWAQCKDAFVWIECPDNLMRFVIETGLIPQACDLSNLINDLTEKCVHTDDINQIKAGSRFKSLFQQRMQNIPKNPLIITPFGSLTQQPFTQSFDALSLALNLLFFLPDVPLITGCLPTALSVPNAYDNTTNNNWARKWGPPHRKFSSLLKERAASRMRADWALQGDVTYLPVTYDSQPMDTILAIARVDPLTGKCALICTGFYMYNLIFEVEIRKLSIIQNLPEDSIVEIKPLINVAQKTSYYALSEVRDEGSALFLEVDKFGSVVYEIIPITPPIPSVRQRTLMEDVFTRLERAMDHNSFTVLAHNYLFNGILKIIEQKEIDQEALMKLIRQLPQADNLVGIFRKALFFATRFTRDETGKTLKEYNDDPDILPREKMVLNIMEKALELKDNFIHSFGVDLVKSNALGPIFFVAPELGPFSKVGGLSTMVWDLAKELVHLGLDIHVISPYYNVSPKGETGYLAKYGIEYRMVIEIYCPAKVEVGIHYGVVDGVKCWFLHNYSYFAAPYQTGSASFRLQTLVIMARASLELCCQERIIPSLFITNDSVTGMTAAYARHSFGNVFNGSRFIHIFHNLGTGYAGKIWPSDGNVGALRSIHQLPEELIVDPFDHSFDPSLCALLCTDQWATVSKQYRWELLTSSPYKYFLERFPKPFAYSNGIRLEERLAAIQKLGKDHAQAKAAIQQKYFGEVDENKCVFVFVGRIVEQKGVYLIIDSFEELNRQFNGQLQFIVGGQANPDDRSYGLPCTQRMMDLHYRYPKQFWADPSSFFSDGLLAYQGADYTLVPSLFEPSGIVQQESFASGTPVIAFKTGGLADTVFEFDKEKMTGNGFNFLAHRHRDFTWAVQRATDLFQNHKDLYAKLRKNAFNSTLSTDTVARAWAREFARLFTKVFEPPEELSKLKPE
jgi:starch synthase